MAAADRVGRADGCLGGFVVVAMKSGESQRSVMARNYREWRSLGPTDAEMARNIYLRLRPVMKVITGRGYVPEREPRITRRYG